jgi:RimJ/RimL family protein N-acetyltransferase
MTEPAGLVFPSAFETERLLVRAPRPGDGAELHAAIIESLAELTPWMPWAQEPQSPLTCENDVLSAYADFLARRDLRLQLYLRSAPETMVGSSGLHRIDWSVPRLEIGYWLRTRFAGQGYATEAVRGVAAFAFRELGAERLEIWCDERNERSAAVARRAGFRHEATLRHRHRDVDGALATDLGFGLLRGEAHEVLGLDISGTTDILPDSLPDVPGLEPPY